MKTNGAKGLILLPFPHSVPSSYVTTLQINTHTHIHIRATTLSAMVMAASDARRKAKTEEVTWEEAQYWSEDTVADFIKRGGKIKKIKPGETAGRKVDWTKSGSGHNIGIANAKHKFPRSRLRRPQNSEYAPDHGETLGESTAAQRRKLAKLAADAPESGRGNPEYRTPTKKHVGKEYAISRTTGKPGAKPRLVRGGGKSTTRLALDKIERREEVTWEEAQYWDEGAVEDWVKQGGKITHGKPRNAKGATRKKTIRLRSKGGTKSTADRGRKAEKKVHGEEYSLDEAKMGEILRNTKKGTAPYTIVAHKAGRVVGQEHTKTVQAVPAFVREIQKKYPNAKISVEDRRGRVLHTEEYADLGEISDRLAKKVRSKRREQERHAWNSLYKSHDIEPRTPEVKAAEKPAKIIITKSHKLRDLMNRRGSEDSRRRRRAKAAMAQQQEEKEIEEAVSVDGRTRDYRGTRTRLESKGRRLGAGLDGRTRGYRDARARTMARQQRVAADAAMMEPTEDADRSMEESSKQGDKIETSSQARKRRNAAHQKLLKITGAKKSKSPRKAAKGKTEISKTASRYENVASLALTKGERVSSMKRSLNSEETIDKEELKRLIHNRTLNDRADRKKDKAAERTAKTKRSFGPKGKKPAGTMKIAFQRALDKKAGRGNK